jgi:uncharacterized membrane protein HdeD (DUF308 family)
MTMEASERVSVAEAAKQFTNLWWLWLVFGAIWTVIAVVILQFDDASITTVGVLIGLMFFVGAQRRPSWRTVSDGSTGSLPSSSWSPGWSR